MPSTLKSLEHGAIGEARAKALLLERFWVLERSVDIQGADYLIQRRLTDQSFMDRSPPKLAVIQVKYVQDGNTYISIDKDYVCDTDGKIYGEFFLLVFTGRESKSRSFLMSAEEVLASSNEKISGDRVHLVIKASNILNTQNNEILNHTLALDRIDHALKTADFVSNRRFLSSTSYISINEEDIDFDLLLPLDNHYAEIGKAFFEEKKKMQTVLFEIEDVVESMQNILRAKDPELAFDIYENEIHPHVAPGRGLHFSAEFFDDDDFLSAVQNHKNRLSAIRALGLESSFFSLLNTLESVIPDKVVKLSLDKGDRVRITLNYETDSLLGISIKVERCESDEECPKLIHSQPGNHIIEFIPDKWRNYDFQSGKYLETSKPVELEEMYRANSWKFRRPFQSEIEKHLLGEDLALMW